MATIRGDGDILVDDSTIPVNYSVTRVKGREEIAVTFSTLADYGRCRDGKAVVLRSRNGSEFRGFITGAFGEQPVRFVITSDE